ncbi:CdaR family protein [Azotosporobacter soli]|uniref:CdaR family protein n=1 Tax=Azotosporobacter soli TaxID=3055040 RepID=UPI0031FF12DA
MEFSAQKNMPAKILALILAVVLWVYVMNDQNPMIESSVEVPLEVRNQAAATSLLDVPEKVKIKVRAPRNLLINLQNQEIKAFIDLKGIGEGRSTVKVYTAVPTNLEVAEVFPEKINLRLEPIIARQVPVEVRLGGTPSVGTMVSKVSASQQTVSIEGPQNLLETVNKVVAVVDISGRNADFTAEAPVQILNSNDKVVEGVKIAPDHIQVAVQILQGIGKKQLDIKALTFGDLPKGMRMEAIMTMPNKVEASGSEKILEKMEFVYTEPVNLTGLDKDTEIDVPLQAKDGIAVAPSAVKVRILIRKQ